MSIQQLPPDVIAQIKSSTTITSLNGVVTELVKNSLDARASKIDISIDYGRGSCVVEDNGLGIPPSEFKVEGGLGKLYRKLVAFNDLNTTDFSDSSKLSNQTPAHGNRGTFLASLSAMSVLSVASHHHSHQSHNAISLHKSDVVLRQTPCPAQHHLQYEHGTRVTVRDLFGNMPVRVKQRAIVSETQQASSKLWRSLMKDVVMFLLAWSNSVSVIVRQAGSTNRLIIKGHTDSIAANGQHVSVERTCNVLSQAQFISPDEASFWVPVGAKMQHLTLSGTISLRPSATRHVQFLALGIQPIPDIEGHNVLYDEINRLFTNSAFGNEEELEELGDAERIRRASDRRYKSDGYTIKALKGCGKGVDRWPMFYINIQHVRSRELSDRHGVDDILDNKSNMLHAITDLLEVMIHEFLSRHHFRPRAVRRHQVRTESRRSPTQSERMARGHQSESTGKTISTAAADLDGKKPQNATFDLFGSNVKLPSFRRVSSDFQTPLSSWSRIKSGASPFNSVEALSKNTVEAHGERVDQSITLGNIEATPTEASNSYSKTGGRASAPLVAKSGKLLRKPFSDIEQPPRSRSVPPTASSDKHFEHLDSGTVTWMNPITKVTSLVDKQTGHVIPAKRKKDASSCERLTTSKTKGTLTSKPASPSTWIGSVLRNWDNPVFCPAEIEVPQVSLDGPVLEAQRVLHGRHRHCSQIDIDRAFKESSAGINSKISKSALRNAEIISQVDKKFILVKIRAASAHSPQDDNALLVLVDQHAADERIRVESLIAELCKPSTDASDAAAGSIYTQYLDKPIAYEIPTLEAELFNKHVSYFAKWGFSIKTSATKVSKSGSQQLLDTSLPPLILERCRSDPKILISLLRTEVHAQEQRPSIPTHPKDQNDQPKQHWLHKIHDCPQSLLDMLNSRACRSAIMFNDELSKTQCQTLIRDLADCAFPFQCAHGRPSLVPLVDLRMLGGGEDARRVEGAGFGEKDGEFRKTLKAYVAQRREK